MIAQIGMRFEHSRKIVGDGQARRPDVCTVTAVRRGTVYFRTESGSLYSADADRFEAAVGRAL